MTLGASLSGQFVYGAVALAFGILGGIPSLLYFVRWRTLNKIESSIVDFVTTALISTLFLVAVEVGGDGQITWYSVLLFLLGAYISSRSLKRLRAFCARRTHRKLFKK